MKISELGMSKSLAVATTAISTPVEMSEGSITATATIELQNAELFFEKGKLVRVLP
jgi:hypothetical protein